MPEIEISAYAQRFVERAFERFRIQANKGCGLYYELFQQKFTDSVNALINRTNRADLRDYIHSKAMNDCNYVSDGRWTYRAEQDEVKFYPHDRVREAKKSFDRLIERMESDRTQEKHVPGTHERSIDR